MVTSGSPSDPSDRREFRWLFGHRLKSKREVSIMRSIAKAYAWVSANDWRGLVALMLTQLLVLGAWYWFALWVSDYARLNWY